MSWNYKQISGIKRLPYLGQKKKSHKPYMDWDTFNKMFIPTVNYNQEVIVEEKLDGSTTYREVDNYVFFIENLKVRHTVHYNKLPDFHIVFDVYCKDCEVFVKREEKENLCELHGFNVVPLLWKGEIRDYTELDDYVFRPFIIREYKSKLGNECIEGVTIKNYDNKIFGKYIRSEFEEKLKDQVNYIKQRRPEKEQYNWIKV